jgi:hypothetical protein
MMVKPTDREIPPMPQTEYEAAIAAFLTKRPITRCPTACVAPTRTAVSDPDRAALSDYAAAREAERVEKISQYRQRLAG